MTHITTSSSSTFLLPTSCHRRLLVFPIYVIPPPDPGKPWNCLHILTTLGYVWLSTRRTWYVWTYLVRQPLAVVDMRVPWQTSGPILTWQTSRPIVKDVFMMSQRKLFSEVKVGALYVWDSVMFPSTADPSLSCLSKSSERNWID